MHPLAQFRLIRELTQKQLAAKIDVSDTLIRRAEQGQPIRRATIDKLVAHSGGYLTVDDFVEAIRDKRKGQSNGKASKRRSKVARTQTKAGGRAGRRCKRDRSGADAGLPRHDSRPPR